MLTLLLDVMKAKYADPTTIGRPSAKRKREMLAKEERIKRDREMSNLREFCVICFFLYIFIFTFQT